MVKVRFLEACYLFSTRKSYDVNEVTFLDKEQAEKLYNRGNVDILKDEEVTDEKVLEEDIDSLRLDKKYMPELQDMADKLGVDHAGLRKAELITALKEVL